MDNKKSQILTLFDQNTIGNSTQMIKSLIPYLEPHSQRMVAILVRMRELMLTIQYYSSFPPQKLAFHSNDEILSQVKKYCSPEMESQIDLMMKMFSMSELMNVLSGIEGVKTDNAGMSDLMNLLGMMKGNDTMPPFASGGFPGFNEHSTDLFNQYMQELNHVFEGDHNNENRSKETFAD